MLSDHERQTLIEIERRLVADDPGWARAFDDARQRLSRRRAFKVAAYIVALVVAVALTVLMVVAQAPGPALFFGVVTGLLIWLTRRLRRRVRAGTAQLGPEQPGSGASEGSAPRG